MQSTWRATSVHPVEERKKQLKLKEQKRKEELEFIEEHHICRECEKKPAQQDSKYCKDCRPIVPKENCPNCQKLVNMLIQPREDGSHWKICEECGHKFHVGGSEGKDFFDWNDMKFGDN